MHFVLCLQRRSLSVLKVFATSAMSVYKEQWSCFSAVELVRRGVLIMTAQISNSAGVSVVCSKFLPTAWHPMHHPMLRIA